VRGGGVGRLRWSGKSATPRRASSKWVGALGPAEEERGRLVRSGDGEPVAETGAEAAASLPVDGEAKARTRCTGGSSFIVASTGNDEAARGGGLRSVVLRRRERTRAAQARSEADRGRGFTWRRRRRSLSARRWLGCTGQGVAWDRATRRAWACQRMVPTRLRAHAGRTTPESRWRTFGRVSSASGAGGVRLRRQAPGTASWLEQRRAIAEQQHSGGGTPWRTTAGVMAQGGRRTRGLPCGVGW
jgi:hypothetical protein